MQVAYQFPELVERLVLVASGGLGREVSLFLRAVTLPGRRARAPADRLAPAVLDAGAAVSAGARPDRAAGRLGPRRDRARHRVAERAGAAARSCTPPRAVIDAGGQRVDARDRLYLADGRAVAARLGRADPIIPAEHGRRAHELMPGSRLELFERAGHFPHLDDPLRFTRVLRAFTDSTVPADVQPERARELMLARAA